MLKFQIFPPWAKLVVIASSSRRPSFAKTSIPENHAKTCRTMYSKFTLGVPPGTKLDGKTLWYADMFNHSSSIFVNKGARRVEYLPIQGIWLHGARKPEFKMMPIFEMHAVMHYSIRLEFGKRSGGKLPGKITFCGESDSFLKTPESILIGTFNAAIKTPGRVH